MAASTNSQSTSLSKKRPLEEDDGVTQEPLNTNIASSLHILEQFATSTSSISIGCSPPESNSGPRLASLAPDSTSCLSGDLPLNLKPGTSANSVATKRRKLTPQETEQRRLNKEAKVNERAKQKVKREEDRKIKDEEKRTKDEERKRKHGEKEEKKRMKELELLQKEEEKRKKERSQMKINAFFSAASYCSSGINPPNLKVALSNEPRHRSPSIEPGEAEDTTASRAPCSGQKKLSDYERVFLPFELPANTRCTQHNIYVNEDNMDATRREMDKYAHQAMEQSGKGISINLIGLPSVIKIAEEGRGPRGLKVPCLKDVISQLYGSSVNPIDLTDCSILTSEREPLRLLKTIPMKYIHFSSDVRPPYCGTYTQQLPDVLSRQLARNPTSRILPDTNYDYDSEAEWEEPEEGEDLDSDGEEDEEDNEGADDLEGFLDDDGVGDQKRKIITGDLEPICSGLYWEDNKGVLLKADGSGEVASGWVDYEMGVLLNGSLHSIDPFSTSYWEPDPTPAPTVPSGTADGLMSTLNGLMNPPRLPLSARPNSLANGKPPKRLIPPQYLEDFKQAIQGSDLTKIALIEDLKKRFPKIPKDAIANTVGIIAARIGTKNPDKRWVIINEHI